MGFRLSTLLTSYLNFCTGYRRGAIKSRLLCMLARIRDFYIVIEGWSTRSDPGSKLFEFYYFNGPKLSSYEVNCSKRYHRADNHLPLQMLRRGYLPPPHATETT